MLFLKKWISKNSKETLKDFNPSSEIKLKDFQKRVQDINELLQNNYQSKLNNGKNLWILIPGSKSDDVKIQNNLNEIITVIRNNSNLIVQK